MATFVCWVRPPAQPGAYMTARFQMNRRKSPIRNKVEYLRHGVNQGTVSGICTKCDMVYYVILCSYYTLIQAYTHSVGIFSIRECKAPGSTGVYI